MSRITISVLFSFVAFTAVLQAQTAESSPKITIQVAGLQAGKAYLIGFFQDQRYRLDSTDVDASGKMTFQRKDLYPEGLVGVALPGNLSGLQLITDKTQQFTLSTRADDLVNAMQVSGSLENELLYQNLRFETQQQPKFQELAAALKTLAADSPAYKEAKARQDQLVAERKAHLDEIFKKYPQSFFTKFKKAGQNPDPKDVRNPDGSLNSALQVYLFRTAFWDGVDFTDDRLLNTPVIANKLRRYINELTVQDPDSINAAADFLVKKLPLKSEYYKFVVNWIVLNYEPTKTSLMDHEAVYVHMVQSYFTADKAFWAIPDQIDALQQRAMEMQASLVGKKGPNVRAKDPNGQYRSIDEISAPYVVVFMFNPTCEHCIEQTPKLLKFYNEWKSKGVEIFGIALDTDENEWKGFIQKYGLPWINVFDPTNKSIYATYFVDITPEIYVLNPQRKIIGKNLKVEQIATIIERDQKK